jgi:predicted amidohydrolase
MSTLKLCLGQFLPKKGDYHYNLEKVGLIFEQLAAEDRKIDILSFPETALTGYFLEGGVREVSRTQTQVFKDLQELYLRKVGANAPLLDVTVGYYEEFNGALYNASLYATLGAASSGIIANHRKFFLATYSVFDEERFVARGRKIQAFDTRFGRFGMLICEDVWHSISGSILALQGAKVVFVGNASPARGFSTVEPSNLSRWRELAKAISDEHQLFTVLTNLVGFEGGKGFIGNSIVTNPWGEVLIEAEPIKECLVICDINLNDVIVARGENPLLSDLQSVLPDVIAELNTLERF